MRYETDDYSNDTEAKVRFLGSPDAYAASPDSVAVHETHMSWVFLAGDHVYKLKKPVRFPYLDFSSCQRREKACRDELTLNQRLAAGIYLDVVPLSRGPDGLAIGGGDDIVDWLVVTKRLASEWMLDEALAGRRVTRKHLDRLAEILVDFYRHGQRCLISPNAHLADWRGRITENRKALTDRRFGLPRTVVTRIDRCHRRFIAEYAQLIADRALRRKVVDGHGDLRPEHIALAEPIVVIDRLEFNPAFRAVDPFDELALLAVECAAIGFPRVGGQVSRRVMSGLHDDVRPILLTFYRSYRAAMRARLAAAHLSEADGRGSILWRPRALRYLELAMKEAIALERHFAGRGRIPVRRLRSGMHRTRRATR